MRIDAYAYYDVLAIEDNAGYGNAVTSEKVDHVDEFDDRHVICTECGETGDEDHFLDKINEGEGEEE